MRRSTRRPLDQLIAQHVVDAFLDEQKPLVDVFGALSFSYFIQHCALASSGVSAAPAGAGEGAVACLLQVAGRLLRKVGASRWRLRRRQVRRSPAEPQ